MTVRIDNQTQPLAPQTTESQKAAGSQNEEGKQAAATHAGSVKTSNSVHITQHAETLARAEKQIADQGEIDHKKVAALKERIESGSYEVNAERLAEKLLKLEDSLSE